MSPVIEVRQLEKIYDGGVAVHALRGVDLRIERGTFVAIVGPSGSGKSTLLYLIGTLEMPSSGEIHIHGQNVNSLSDEERTLLRRRKIGFVFQQFNLLPIFTAAENVALPLRLEGVATTTADARASEMLGLVGLAERRDHLPSQLSGGEQQRVAVARALVADPTVILADEPTGSLDSASGENLVAIFRRLVDEQGHTVILVTHDLAVAAQADRVVAMRDGRIVDDYEPSRRAAIDEEVGEPRP